MQLVSKIDISDVFLFTPYANLQISSNICWIRLKNLIVFGGALTPSSLRLSGVRHIKASQS